MIECAMVGDDDRGYWAEAERDLKIDRLNLPVRKIAYDDLRMLSQIVQQEAGDDALTNEHRILVASTVINRMNSPEFPDTLYEVLCQPYQYGGTRWQDQQPSRGAVLNALFVLEHGSQAPRTRRTPEVTSCIR